MVHEPGEPSIFHISNKRFKLFLQTTNLILAWFNYTRGSYDDALIGKIYQLESFRVLKFKSLEDIVH